MKKKNSTKTLIIKGIAVLSLIVMFSYLLYHLTFSKQTKPYTVSTNTSEKFQNLKQWILYDSDFIAVADVFRLQKDPSLVNFFESGLLAEDNILIKAVHQVVASNAEIGMIAVCLNFDKMNDLIPFLVTIQANFGDQNILETIKKELSKDELVLEMKLINGIAMYTQKDMESNFAFSIPNNNHLIIGTRFFIEDLLDNNSVTSSLFQYVDSPFFGELNSSEKIKNIVPPQIASFEKARFATNDNGYVNLSISLPGIDDAKSLAIFLSGMKTLYSLQTDNQENKDIDLIAIDKFSIDTFGQVVVIEAPLEELMKISSRY